MGGDLRVDDFEIRWPSEAWLVLEAYDCWTGSVFDLETIAGTLTKHRNGPTEERVGQRSVGKCQKLNRTNPSTTRAFFPEASTCLTISPRAKMSAFLRSDFLYAGGGGAAAAAATASAREARRRSWFAHERVLESDSPSDVPECESSWSESVEGVDERLRLVRKKERADESRVSFGEDLT